MKPLITEFTRGKKGNQTEYSLIDRNKKVAWYRCIDQDLDVYYEIFKIRRQKKSESIISGTLVKREAKELYPNDNCFGNTAWTTRCDVKAEQMFNNLKKLYQDDI